VAAAAAKFHFLDKYGAEQFYRSSYLWQAVEMRNPSYLRPMMEEIDFSLIESQPYRQWLKERRKMARFSPHAVKRALEGSKVSIYLLLFPVMWLTIDNRQLAVNIENRP
jgi:hypothetical protein